VEISTFRNQGEQKFGSHIKERPKLVCRPTSRTLRTRRGQGEQARKGAYWDQIERTIFPKEGPILMIQQRDGL
jgi:hypothetical protein